MNSRAGAIAKFEMAREEVGVKVRQEDMTNRKSAGLRVFEILFDVALRIDDDSDAGLFVADEVRGVRQATQIVLFQQHGNFLLFTSQLKGVRQIVPRLIIARVDFELLAKLGNGFIKMA